MTNRDLVLTYLRSMWPANATNREILEATGVRPHQQVYRLTQQLMGLGLIVGGKDGGVWRFSADKHPRSATAGVAAVLGSALRRLKGRAARGADGGGIRGVVSRPPALPRRSGVWAKVTVLVAVPTAAALLVWAFMGGPLTAPLAGETSNAFLSCIAQVLAGILAIVFSVTVLAIEIASNRYMPRLYSYFMESTSTRLTLLSLLGCIVLAVVGIGVDTMPMLRWQHMGMVGLFVFCLLMLPYYLRESLHLLDPRNLAKRVEAHAARAIRGGDIATGEDDISALGDVAVKALNLGEEEVATAYLDSLARVQTVLAEAGLPPIAGAQRGSAAPDWPQSHPGSPVVAQYYRVFRLAVQKEASEITSHTVVLLQHALSGLLGRGSSAHSLRGLLYQYQEFVDAAVSGRDVSRFRLLGFFRDAVFEASYSQPADDRYRAFFLTALKAAGQTVIDGRDSELWQWVLSYFSSIPSIEQASESLHRSLLGVATRIRYLDTGAPQDSRAQLEAMAWKVRTRITGTNKRVVEMALSELTAALPGSNEVIVPWIGAARQELQTLWAATGVYDVFFELCVHALYHGATQYIKELWQHVNPPDARAMWVNANLVHLDIGFLTHQMVAYTLIPWQIEGYHSAEPYVLRYYLLCLALTLRRTRRTWRPEVGFFSETVLTRGDDYAQAVAGDVRSTHTFIANLPYYAKEAAAEYETLASRSKEWDDVLDGEASDALARAREWLSDETREAEWQELGRSIIRKVPLDRQRVEAYEQDAVQYYHAHTRVPAMARTSPDRECAADPVRLAPGEHRDKSDFTVISPGGPADMGKRIGFGAVHALVQREVEYITQTILRQAEPLQVESLTFDHIAEAAVRISGADRQADVLVAPAEQISRAWRTDPEFNRRLNFTGEGERYLQLEESARMTVLERPGQEAVVLDRNAGRWKTVETVQVQVVECRRDRLAVDIVARETVCYELVHPDAVVALQFLGV